MTTRHIDLAPGRDLRIALCPLALALVASAWSCELRQSDRPSRASNEPGAPQAAEPATVAAPQAAAAPIGEPTPKALADEGAGEAGLMRWAQRHAAERSGGATLSQIAVIGAEPAAETQAAGRGVRVVLHFDEVAVYRRGELPAQHGLPRRLVLDLDGVRVGSAVPAALPVGAGGLARVRTFALDEGRIRVSFDVGPSTAYRLFFLNDPFRVVMDFRAEAPPRPAPLGERPVVVVIDPGHGGEQPGAKGPNGLKESHVALALALRVRNALVHNRPGLRVVMTRTNDRLVSLEERSAIANAVDADLFVSIHLNASTLVDEQGGVATFVLDTTDDQAALRLAARENDTNVEGVSQLQRILASLYRKDQVEHSRVLAEAIQESTLRSGRRVLGDLRDRGVKSAMFYVLVGAQMPAVLVEASFITREKEAAALATEPYRQVLADGIAEGILRYVERVRSPSSLP